LDEDSPAIFTPTDHPRSLNEQRHRLFCSSISGSKQFLVKIKEDDDICFIDSVEHSLSAHIQICF
jgi:hypothetical protein